MSFFSKFFGSKEKSSARNIPPFASIPPTVKIIHVYMPNLDAAKRVVDRLPSPGEIGSQLKILGGPTNQGRHQLQIEGRMTKAIAYRILQIVDGLGGDIQAIGG